MRLVAIVLTGLSLAAQERQIGRGVNAYSLEKEAALGALLANDVRKNSTLLDNPAVQAYVEQVGHKLAMQLPQANYKFELIADDPNGAWSAHEPVALPGGYIFVSAKLMLAARDDAELAGMLAHAMAHIAARHGTRMATRGQIANQATIPLIYMGAGNAGAMMPVGFASFQRVFEFEADSLAAKAMADAGYDSRALIRYIGREQPEQLDAAIRSMPTREVRIAALEKQLGDDSFSNMQEQVRKALPPPTEVGPDRPPTLRRQ